MASPFSIFRKNQKVWMAGITILAIVAFVFLSGPVANSFRGSGGREEPVVTTTKFGNLGAGQLQMLRFNRQVFVDFLEASPISVHGRASRCPMPWVKVEQAIGTGDNEAVINKWLFVREAEAMGITVDDKALNSFLG